MLQTNFLAGQGLGNQLWVYASVRGIAQKLQLPFYFGSQNLFKGKDFLNIDLGSQQPEDSSLEHYFKERMYFDAELQYYASDYDDRVQGLGRNTYIEGLFQSERYLDDLTGNLSEIIILKKKEKDLSRQFSSTCVVNIRGGEYKRHKQLILPKQYWIDGISHMKDRGLEQFLIVTDDPNYARYLLPGIEVLNGGVAECYAALHGAESVIVSNSSFSYFPIKTREDRPMVIAPYQWSRFGNHYDRWAAPCNLYSNWLWQDMAGNLYSYEECENNAMTTKKYYEDSYNLCVDHSMIHHSVGFSRVPDAVKRPIKTILSKLFPGRIG